jgi:hypothetical protein
VLVYSPPGDKLVHKVHLNARVILKTWNNEFKCKFRNVFSEADEDNIVGYAQIMPQHNIVVYDSGEIRDIFLASAGTKEMLKHKLGRIKTC